jgi:hypothetical protein
MSGMQLGALVQDSTTTTGTGAITLANSLQTGLPNGTTLFGATFAPAGVYPVYNVFYTIQDGTGNNEYGIGTLTSATNLTRDFVLFSQAAGSSLQTVNCDHVNFASGTKQVYSNQNLFANSVALWSRVPQFINGGDGELTNDVMSGTFSGLLTSSSATTAITVRYKISSNGVATIQFPATTPTQTGTTLSITGVPGFLCNVLAESVPCLVTGTSAGGVIVPGIMAIAGGATPQATGTYTFSQYASLTTGYTATFTTGVANGVPAQSISYALF